MHKRVTRSLTVLLVLLAITASILPLAAQAPQGRGAGGPGAGAPGVGPVAPGRRAGRTGTWRRAWPAGSAAAHDHDGI